MDEPSAQPLLSIELTNGVESIREFYFADGRESIFTYKPTRASFLTAVLLSVFTGVFYGQASGPNSIFIAVALGLGSVISWILFTSRALKYGKWKSRVVRYIHSVGMHEKWQLKVFPYSFEVINPSETSIERWKNIKKASFRPVAISMRSDSGANYLFPAKSMTPAEYESLNGFIKEKMHEILPADANERPNP